MPEKRPSDDKRAIKNKLPFKIYLSLVLLLKKVTLMILLEGFLVIPIISLTKNPSRRIINVTWMS